MKSNQTKKESCEEIFSDENPDTSLTGIRRYKIQYYFYYIKTDTRTTVELVVMKFVKFTAKFQVSWLSGKNFHGSDQT